MSQESVELSTQRTEDSKSWTQAGAMDQYLTTCCLEKTIGEVNALGMAAQNVRARFGCQLIMQCIFSSDAFSPDINIIKQVIKRIDGTVPDADQREGYANLIGDALEDVMDMTAADQTQVYPDDLTIIALAKAILYVSMQDCGKNYQKKKDRQTAIEIILERTGGRKSAPVKQTETVSYIAPTWRQSLPT